MTTGLTVKNLSSLALVLFLLEPVSLGQQDASSGRQHGRRSLAIVRVATPPTLDGLLNEEVWRNAPVAGDFLQRDPHEGMAASEQTEVQVLYDSENLYFGVMCSDSQAGGILATELRRDNRFNNDDSFAIILDTFHDHRNSFLFRVNPKGTQYDALITEEGRDVNANWDEKWEVETQVNEEGWSAEIKIPLKSIRYSTALENPTFGIDFERVIRRKNEFDRWNNYSRNFRFNQVSQAGHLAGMEELEVALRVRIKPYVSSLVRRHGEEERTTNFLGDVGLEDLKYRVSSSLTMELTANTDFAQTEVDNQIINFDRIPTFFPEKREFFLEGAGIYEFRDFGSLRGEGTGDVRLYHSRRIGLSEDGRTVPVLVGAKLTGKVGEKFTLGLLEAQTDDFQDRPGDNFAVFRLKRDLLSRSSVGVLFTNRQAEGGDYNRVVGIDKNLILFEHLNIAGMLAHSFTDGVADRTWIKAVGGGWQDDLLNTGFAYTIIEENFTTDLGFLPRRGVKKYGPYFFVSPRPDSQIIRQFRFGVRYDHYRNLDDNSLNHDRYHFAASTTFQNGSSIRVSPHCRTERFDEPEMLPGGLEVSPGRYNWCYLPVMYSFDPSGKVSGSFQYRYEKDYYGKGGRRQTWEINPVVKFGSHFSAEIDYSLNRIQLSGGEPVNTHQVNNKFNLALSRKLLASTIVQYNSDRDRFGVNFRLNYIYRPGDDLFIVYNEFQDRRHPITDIDRSLIFKLTHSFDF